MSISEQNLKILSSHEATGSLIAPGFIKLEFNINNKYAAFNIYDKDIRKLKVLGGKSEALKKNLIFINKCQHIPPYGQNKL